MTQILAIDPGPVKSAWCLFDAELRLPQDKGIDENHILLNNLPDLAPCGVVIEMIASYGRPVGAEVFETCVWIGRFWQASKQPVHRITRLEVKMALCHDSRAKDPHIRQRLIDLYGGKDAAIGKKKTPGPLYGFHADEWAALAVAWAWARKEGGNEWTC